MLWIEQGSGFRPCGPVLGVVAMFVEVTAVDMCSIGMVVLVGRRIGLASIVDARLVGLRGVLRSTGGWMVMTSAREVC